MFNIIKKFALPAIVSLVFATPSIAQDDDLMKLLDENQPKTKQFTTATFKTTRITNFQSCEVVGRRGLDFRIMHRFGPFNSGAYNAWGIDGPANIKLSLEYSHDGRLMFGLGRSSLGKMIDGFAKFKLLRQSNSMPVTVTLFSSAYYTRIKDAGNGDNRYANELNRLSYCHQIIIARKFNPWLSIQIAPTLVHYNLVEKSSDLNDIYAVCGATRVKITNRMAITLEYCYRINNYSPSNFTNDPSKSIYYNSFGVGWEIETGGHVFQMHVTNSMGINENQFIPYTTSSWKSKGIRIGFNISRVFTLGKPKDLE